METKVTNFISVGTPVTPQGLNTANMAFVRVRIYSSSYFALQRSNSWLELVIYLLIVKFWLVLECLPCWDYS